MNETENKQKQTVNETDETNTAKTNATLDATANEPGNLVTLGSSQVKPGDNQTDEQAMDKTRKKKLSKAERAKLAKDRLAAGAAASMCSQKRPANLDDTVPPNDRPLKKHKDVEDGLTVAQRTDNGCRQ